MATYSTRKINFRRLGHQHGDNLSQLRNPPRAEAARPLLGQLEAHRVGMKKQLDLWYKEQNFNINKINRGQAKVYKTFLKTHYDQRRLARIATEKKRQQELQEATSMLSSDYGSSSDRVMPRVGALSLEVYQKLPGITTGGHPDVIDVKRETGEDEKDGGRTGENVGKKYNRHRSEFSVVVNAPAAIPVIEAAIPDVFQHPNTATGANPAEVGGENKIVIQGKSERRAAKVLVVRKQSPDGGWGRKEGSFLTEQGDAGMVDNNGGGFVREGSRSFIQERSGSIYIQTITMANAEIGEKAAENNQPKPETAKSPIQPLLPAQTLIHDCTSASMALPAISEDTPKKPKVDDSSVPKPKPSQLTPRRKAPNYKLGELKVRIVKKKPAPPTSYTVAILEREKQRESLLGGVSDGTSSRLTRSDNDGNLVYSRADDISISNSKRAGNMTMAEINRRRRKQRDADMREVLDRETPVLYEKNEQGEIVKSGYDFKRREFKRPSSREKKARKKLLRQSRETQKEERERVIKYIDKLSEEERQERQDRERRVRQKEQDAAAARAEAKKLRAAETDPGQLLRSLIRAFRKGDPAGQSGDPNSVSSLENCSYIRVYNADQRVRSANKKSSWRQKTVVVRPR